MNINTQDLLRPKSKAAFDAALQVIPGGVDSPVRALKAVGTHPVFVKKTDGAFVYDLDDHKYLDFCLSWGVFLLGHNHPQVARAVHQAVDQGTSYGMPCLNETALAQKIRELMPSMEKVRFVNSGTEAVMSAIRLARGFTKRNYIVKFAGCYHGHADHLLVSAGSGVARLAGASSAGVPDSFVQYTLCLPFNDKEAITQAFKEHGHEIAAIIVEPVPANMGVVPAHPGFLEYLRKLSSEYGSLLIFDEVITGFRFFKGSAQGYFGIKPDLSTVGKIAGGGFPAAAFGGRKEIMDLLAPDGPVYQAGTLSGNPVAMAAGLATLNILSQPHFYDELLKKTDYFFERLNHYLPDTGAVINHVGTMFTPFFTQARTINNFEDVKACDPARLAKYFRFMLNNGVYTAPSQFEANFISMCHSLDDLERTTELIGWFFKHESELA